MMWFFKHRHTLIVLGICSALLAATVLGAERAALAAGLSAVIVYSLFDLFELPKR